MEPIKDILPKNLKKSGIAVQVAAAMVTDYFFVVASQIVAPAVAKKAKALYLKDKILTVACLSSVLAQELKLNEGKIIRAMNERFGAGTIERLRFLN